MSLAMNLNWVFLNAFRTAAKADKTADGIRPGGGLKLQGGLAVGKEGLVGSTSPSFIRQEQLKPLQLEGPSSRLAIESGSVVEPISSIEI